jgi:hypothetical protein
MLWGEEKGWMLWGEERVWRLWGKDGRDLISEPPKFCEDGDVVRLPVAAHHIACDAIHGHCN